VTFSKTREADLILPSKHIAPNRALLTIGAEILKLLDRPKTVSVLWDGVRAKEAINVHGRIGYDWFVLALDLLFLTNAIEYKNGTLHRGRP
jgi:hypothetical protein